MNKIIIKTDHIYYHYENRKRRALDDVSLNVYRGEWLSIIGRNGSGKSTLIKVLDGLLRVDDGSITINDVSLNNDNLIQIRNMIGMVFQNPDDQFVGSNVEEDIAFGLENHNFPPQEMQSLIDQSLFEVGMKGFNHRSPANLSGGQKQRVALAGIIALTPQIIILDEATSMLDPKSRIVILDLIKRLKEQRQITVIAITHDANEIAYADRLLIMDRGKIVDEQTRSEALNNSQQLRELGLAIPYSEQIRLEMIKQGIKVPHHYLNSEELINWITQLPFKE